MKGTTHTAREFALSHPESAARVLETCDPDEVCRWFGSVAPDVAAGVLGKMVPQLAGFVISRMEPTAAAELLALVRPANALGALRGCTTETQEAILDRLPAEMAARYRTLLRFPEDTAAGLTDSSVFALPDDISVEEAIALCRRNPAEAHHYLYVIDRDHRLRGVVSLMELVTADPSMPLENRMKREVSWLNAGESRANILLHAGWRDFHALPVVDESQRFLGSIRYETLRLLESTAGRRESARAVNEAVKAFGNLYGVALMGLAQGVGTALTPSSTKEPKK